MQEVIFDVEIKTLSPINIGSGAQDKNSRVGFTVRGKKCESYIPGTTIKGNLKYYFNQLIEDEHQEGIECKCSMCELFGKPGFSPSKIFVDDFKLMDTESQEIRSCNRIDRRRRVCVEGALFSKEVVYGTYKGLITAYVEDEKMKERLKAAIQLIQQIGSGKSRGLGSVKVDYKEVEA